MKKILIGLFALAFSAALSAQTFFTKTAKVDFDATSSIEPIKGSNGQSTVVIDATSGKIEAATLVKGFKFRSALMEEHFNENYLESGKFPKSAFVGEIVDMKSVNLKKDGEYPVTVKGKLTMHGVTKDAEAKGKLTVKNGGLTAGTAMFKIACADFNIGIPSAVRDKIAKEVNLTVSANLAALKK